MIFERSESVATAEHEIYKRRSIEVATQHQRSGPSSATSNITGFTSEGSFVFNAVPSHWLAIVSSLDLLSTAK